MSSNFLDISGVMAGVDVHIYYLAGGPVPVPVPDGYVCFSAHASFSRWWRIAWHVTTGHCPVLQSNWQMCFCVPHIPIPIGPPHPAAEPIEIAVCWFTGGSAPQLSVHSVTGGGAPLLTAIVWAFGYNANCGIQGMAWIPTNVDFNMNSVKTTPTLGDYLAGAASMAMNSVYNAATSFIPVPWVSVVTMLAQTAADVADRLNIPVLPWLLDPYTQIINKISSLLQQAADA
jgi:hypothetical protein